MVAPHPPAKRKSWQQKRGASSVALADDRGSAIKVLDLLTHRFYTGVVRSIEGPRLEIQISPMARFFRGQNVRFMLEADAGATIVPQQSMHAAVITRIVNVREQGLYVNLTATTPLVPAN